MRKNDWQISALFWLMVAFLFACRYLGSHNEITRFFGEFLIFK